MEERRGEIEREQQGRTGGMTGALASKILTPLVISNIWQRATLTCTR